MMNKILLGVLLTFGFHLSAFQIGGYVFDQNQKPVSNVVVSTAEKAVVTGKDGRFFLYNIAASDLVTIHKIGYRDIVLRAADLPYKNYLKEQPLAIDGFKISEEFEKNILLDTDDKIVIEVEKSNLKNTHDLLQKAGLHLSGNGLSGEDQNVSVPGFEARHTLVLLDGIPLNKSGDSFDISTIPIEIISSIEIVKGSSSAQTSGGAIGGVVNINTKQEADDVGCSFQQNLGSFGFQKTSISLYGKRRNFSASVSAAYSYASNDFQYKPKPEWNLSENYLERKNNDKEIFDLGVSINFRNNTFLAKYKLIYQDFFKKLPGSILNPDWFWNSRISGQNSRHVFQLKKKIKDYSINTDLYYSIERSTYDNTRLEPPFNNSLYLAKAKNHQIIRGAKTAVKYFTEQFKFDYGADYRYEAFEYDSKIHPLESIDRKVLENYGGFANMKLERSFLFYELNLTGIVRYDKSNRFDDFTTWQIASEFTNKAKFDFTFGGSVANSFSYPSFMSIYWKGDSQVTGNPDLIPEEALSWQLHSAFRMDDHFVKANFRRDKIDNKIVWFIEHNSKWKPENVGEAQITTWEIEAGVNLLESMQIKSIYSKVDAVDKTKDSAYYDKAIIYTPEYTWNSEILYNYNNISMSISYLITGEQWTTRDQLVGEKQLPSYDKLNAVISYNYKSNNWQIIPSFKARNILNEMYEIYDYIPQPGFNWEAGLQIKWEK